MSVGSAVRLAAEIRSATGISGLASGAAIEEMIDAAGLEVWPWEFAPPIQGMLCEQVIGVRPDLEPGARRAVLAHELGHWMLGHTGSLLYMPLTTSQLLRDREEIEAQAFAGTLLFGTTDEGRAFDERIDEAFEDGVPFEFLARYYDAISPGQCPLGQRLRAPDAGRCFFCPIRPNLPNIPRPANHQLDESSAMMA